MNGLELIRSVREFSPNLKVIVLSGYNEFEYLRQGMRLGIENYLLKPINIEELEATLNNTVNKLNTSKAERLFSEYDIRIITDNVLHRWLTKRIATNEFVERAALLQMEMDKPYVRIAVIRTDRLFEPVYGMIGELAEKDKSVIPFCDIDGDIVIVFTMDDPEREKGKAADLLDVVRNAFGESSSIRISLGTVETLMEFAPRSYANAKRAQEYFLLLPETGLMEYDRILGGQRAITAEFPLDWEEYAKWILTKNKEKLFAKIDDDFGRIRKLEGATPQYVQGIAIELLIRFKMELQNIKHADQPDLYKDGFDKVRQAVTIDELVGIIKEVAALTVDSLIRDVKSPVIQLIQSHIHERYAGTLSLKSLGQQYNIHPVYLGHLFQKETNETFTDYINKYRIEKAKEMLRETRLKVHEIANKVGYWETGYFYKQFKKYVGISPTDYKGLL
jgi:two-component system, response regulator YesN